MSSCEMPGPDSLRVPELLNILHIIRHLRLVMLLNTLRRIAHALRHTSRAKSRRPADSLPRQNSQPWSLSTQFAEKTWQPRPVHHQALLVSSCGSEYCIYLRIDDALAEPTYSGMKENNHNTREFQVCLVPNFTHRVTTNQQ